MAKVDEPRHNRQYLSAMAKLLFLPGAGGAASFWSPVANELLPERARRLFSWPGLGREPARPHIQSVDDLVTMVLAEMDEPVDLIAQSMGGLIALRAALAAPASVRRLVLVATSGGLPVEDFGAADWRPGYYAMFPNAPKWIGRLRENLSPQLPTISAPTLLIWGDRDAISPVGVGERLSQLLPNAILRVVAGGEHDVAKARADEVRSIIHGHLAND